MHVEDIMSTPVVVSRKGTQIKYARDLIDRKSINAMPILEEDGTIAGIVSSSDLAKAHDETALIDQIMTDRVRIVLKNNRVIDAAKTMVDHNIHHLVVMEDGNVVGIVSTLDIIKALVQDK